MKHQVFLIDDDDRVLRALSTLLRLSGFEVRGFRDGFDFLAAINDADSGCALVDYRLARGDAFVILEQLKQRSARIVPILISGHADGKIAQQALADGFAAFLSKPFENDELIQTIEFALKRVESWIVS